jgi:hypothetical protein
MNEEQKLEPIIGALDELNEDSTVPKNIKIKITQIVEMLNAENMETSIKVNKTLHLLDEIADDTNLKSYTRTQIWNIVSLLERI